MYFLIIIIVIKQLLPGSYTFEVILTYTYKMSSNPTDEEAYEQGLNPTYEEELIGLLVSRCIPLILVEQFVALFIMNGDDTDDIEKSVDWTTAIKLFMISYNHLMDDDSRNEFRELTDRLWIES